MLRLYKVRVRELKDYIVVAEDIAAANRGEWLQSQLQEPTPETQPEIIRTEGYDGAHIFREHIEKK